MESQEQPAEDEVDAVQEPEELKETEPDSYEARMAERRRRPAERSKEREEVRKTFQLRMEQGQKTRMRPDVRRGERPGRRD